MHQRPNSLPYISDGHAIAYNKNSERTERFRSAVDGKSEKNQARARRDRGMDGHNPAPAVRNDDAGAGVRDSDRLDGGHATSRRSSTGGQAGLRAFRPC